MLYCRYTSFFENGRLYISQYPTKDGRQCDFSEKIDVTEEVAKAIKLAGTIKADLEGEKLT